MSNHQADMRNPVPNLIGPSLTDSSFGTSYRRMCENERPNGFRHDLKKDECCVFACARSSNLRPIWLLLHVVRSTSDWVLRSLGVLDCRLPYLLVVLNVRPCTEAVGLLVESRLGS